LSDETPAISEDHKPLDEPDMVVQEKPVCMGCDEVIEDEPVFQAPCGHEGCSSFVWHGHCLMEFREHSAAHKRIEAAAHEAAQAAAEVIRRRMSGEGPDAAEQP
jgi:hypothetical protein